MLSIRRILFPTDGSACAEHAFSHAVGLAQRHGAALHVLHPDREPDASDGGLPEAPFDLSGLSVVRAEQVVRRARCPVLVVRGQGQGLLAPDALRGDAPRSPSRCSRRVPGLEPLAPRTRGGRAAPLDRGAPRGLRWRISAGRPRRGAASVHAEGGRPRAERDREYARDAARAEAGATHFTALCAACHGPEGQGAIRPNLTDAYWLHGGAPEDVFRVISEGVVANGMPAWEGALSEEERAQMVAFVFSLQGTNPANPKGPQGEEVAGF